MIKRRNQMLLLASAGTAALFGGCVPMGQYDALEQKYNQLNQQLSGEIAQDNARITRLQGAIKVAVNSDLLFPEGGWQMSQNAQQLIARIAPILAPMQQTAINVNGYTDSVPIGPELRARGVQNNQQLSMMRAQNVADFMIAQGVNPGLVAVHGYGDADPAAPNDTAQGRAQNRRVELVLAGSGN